MKFRHLSTAICTTLLTIVFFNVKAQKLPNVQQMGLRAPANVKIDGKPTEWEGKFQARNSATTLTYALSNDDDYLYLVAQTDDQTAINKIMGGGITLLIQMSGERKDRDAMMINYPVYSRSNRIIFTFHRKGEPKIELSPTAADSSMNFNNKRMNTTAKSIRLSGLQGIDTVISVYNDEGVRAVQQFNNRNVYTCELAISLKNLGLSAKMQKGFSYHILLNSGPNKSNGMNFNFTAPSGASPEILAMYDKMNTQTANVEASLYSTTDFWGDYTLVNK